MKSNVAKWGNSLAVRIPAECLRATGLTEGSLVDVSVAANGELRLAPTHAFDKASFLQGLGKLHRRMPESTPVVEAQRESSRY